MEIVATYPQMLERIVPKYAKIKKSMTVEELVGEEGEQQPEEEVE